jgi:hypothetical protein
MTELIEAAKIFGSNVAIIIFFIYRDYLREKSQTAKSDKDSGFIRDFLTDLVKKTTEALANNNSLLLEIKEIMRNFKESQK